VKESITMSLFGTTDNSSLFLAHQTPGPSGLKRRMNCPNSLLIRLSLRLVRFRFTSHPLVLLIGQLVELMMEEFDAPRALKLQAELTAKSNAT